MPPAFDGIRVLELGQIYNGPYCGLLLAQLGADVIKIEPPGGEQLRFRSPAGRVPRVRDAQLQQTQRGAEPEDRLRSPGAARPGRDRRRTHRELRARHHGAPPAAPGTTPRAQPAADRGLRQGLRLHRSLRPHVGDGHHRAGDVGQRLGHRRVRRAADQGRAAFVDFSGGIHLFAAISAALFQRERTGRGQIVEVSMHDTIYPMLASSLGGLHNNPDRAARAHREPALGDGGRAVQHLRDQRWVAGDHLHLRAALARRGRRAGRPELIDDPRFGTEKDRVANIDAVDDEVSSVTRTRTRDELVRDLQAAGVPCAPVKSIREVDTDEHLIQRGMITYVEHPARAGCRCRDAR